MHVHVQIVYVNDSRINTPFNLPDRTSLYSFVLMLVLRSVLSNLNPLLESDL